MADNNLITAHRIGWIIWIYQIIKRTGYPISKAKSVRIGRPATSGNEFFVVGQCDLSCKGQ